MSFLMLTLVLISCEEQQLNHASARNITTEAQQIGDICYNCVHDENRRYESSSRNQTSCRFFQQFRSQGVPERPLRQALMFYENNRSQFQNQRYISIADYSQNSTQKRFYILDLQTGNVRREKVSHGSGMRNGVARGDSSHNGMLDRCHHGNNINDRTNMTRAGFFQTQNFYQSTNNLAGWPPIDRSGSNGLRMRGLSPGVNEEALDVGVVMHGAYYNDLGPRMGRSYGCPAFESSVASSVLSTIRGGSLYYSYTPQCQELQSIVERQVQGWERMCG